MKIHPFWRQGTLVQSFARRAEEEKEMLNVCSAEEALQAMLRVCPAPGEKFTWALLPQATGRVLAMDAGSPFDVPAFTRAAVDGYAVIAADTFGAAASMPTLLTLAGEVKMGADAGFTLARGACAAVPTGGELPQNADAMVMLEDAEALPGGLVAVETPTAPGRHVIFIGDDVRADEVVLPAGRRLGAREIGLLAAIGYDEAPVRICPRVGILSTGDELVSPGIPLFGAQVWDVNGPMLTAAAKEAGAEAQFCGRAPDEEPVLLEKMRTLAGHCDLLILSGGSSAGEKDAVAKCLAALGSVLFHGLAVKPGKPTLGGTIGQTLVLGLPGHPAAAYFMFELLARPIIAHMLGETRVLRAARARLTEAIPSNSGREEVVAVRLADDLAEPIPSKSGLIGALSRADGYVRIPREAEGLPRGAEVAVTLF